MKGLLIKDYRLLLEQKKSLAIFIFIGALALFTDMDMFFTIGYVTFVFSMISISTISYDEFDNGMAFLMTLPPSRRMYVREKFLFGFINAGAVWCISVIAVSLFLIGKGNDLNLSNLLAESLPLLGIAFLFLAVMIPVQLKFGAEKGRIVMFLFMGVCFAIGYLGSKLAEYLQLDITGLSNFVVELNTTVVILILIAAALVVIGIAYQFAVSIMKHRQL